MNNIRWISLAVAICAALMTAGVVPLRQSQSWFDPVTGSMKHQTWLVSIPMPSTESHSEIERWIVRHEGSHRPRWQTLGISVEMLFGGPRIGCTSGIPIYRLLWGDYCADFVRESTDQEIAKFVHIMRTGTEDEQRQAVQTVVEKVDKARVTLK